MEYNILWIDDEYKKQIAFITLAEQENITIYAFESSEEGINDLKQKLDFYDAVILDAKVKHKKEDTVIGLEGLRASRDFLIEHNRDNYLPYFIFTGQPDYLQNEIFEGSFGNYYQKGKDNEQLLNDIIEKANKRPQTKARLNFSEVFLPFQNGILEKKHEHLLLDILINYENKDYRKKNINVQRDLLEAFLKALNNPIPYLKNEFFDDRYNGKPNLEYCVRYIEGQKVNIKTNEFRTDKIIKKTIKSAFRILKESTSELSHLNDEEIVKYPFLNNTFLLLQILIWLPEFVEEYYEKYI